MKRWSASLAIRQMQIKTTRDNHVTRAGMTVIKWTGTNKYEQGGGELETSYNAGGNVKWCSDLGRVWKLLTQLNSYHMTQ